MMFNRPDKTRQMISALRRAKPPRLFLAADGPRRENPEDLRRCADARGVLEEIDWECDVRMLFQDDNLGCKRGPETAITWFFSHVPGGIVLEDDCLPNPAFFPFCAELLERFEEDERVMMIGGYNPLGSWQHTTSSYLFSRTSPTWGWATWRRAWQCYDPDMAAWVSHEARSAVKMRMSSAEYRITRRWFDQVRAGTLDAWDFAWAFAMLKAGGLSIVPVRNMIANIGFGADATHTKNPWSAAARVRTAEVAFPLIHPEVVEPCLDYDGVLFETRFSLGRQVLAVLPQGVVNRIRSVVYTAIEHVRREDF